MKKIIFIFFVFCNIIAIDAFAKSKPILIGRTSYGLIVGFNKGDLHFVVKLNAKNPRYAERQNNTLFNLDNNIIQFIYFDNGIIDEKNVENTLNKFSDSEISYQKKYLKIQVKSKKQFISIQGNKALFWTLEINNPGNEAKYTNLSILKKNRYIISINFSTDKSMPDAKCIQILKKIAQNIKIVDEVLTSESMRKYAH